MREPPRSGLVQYILKLNQNITGYHLKPWQRPHIRTQVYWVGTVLLEKVIIKKYGCSDKEMPQEKHNSDGNLLSPNT